jgi:hypothetical protein
MKLSSVYFDDTVCIPGGKDVGGGLARHDLRESSFHASDGWSIEDIGGGEFRLHREGMERPCIVGGYGYTRVAPPETCSYEGEFSDGATRCGRSPGHPGPHYSRTPDDQGRSETGGNGPVEELTTAQPAAVPDAGTTPKRRRK